MEEKSAMKKGIFIIMVLVLFLAIPAFATQSIKITVAANDKVMTATVSGQAATANYFLFFDQKGKLLEAVQNPFKDADRAGPSVVGFLAGKGITVVVAGGFGPKIVDDMKAKGITPVSFSGVAAEAVKKVLQSK
jgi:predicted Fe-Mo cluster-binding NifX family protein